MCLCEQLQKSCQLNQSYSPNKHIILLLHLLFFFFFFSSTSVVSTLALSRLYYISLSPLNFYNHVRDHYHRLRNEGCSLPGMCCLAWVLDHDMQQLISLLDIS